MADRRPSYYEVLGVDRQASLEEIKKAYRRLAMRYHPDRAQGEPGAEDRFKEASEAYAVLSDPAKRTEYDRFGQVKGFEAGASPFDNASIQAIFSDIFSEIFGRKKKGAKRTRGRDLKYDLHISLEEAAAGAEKEIRIPRKVRCATCNGSGAHPGSELRSCATCDGSGEIKLQQGFFSLKRTCSCCHGEGKIITNPCRTCFGTGLAELEQVLSVKVPSGVGDGQRLRVAGKGEEGVNIATPGDLFVHVIIDPHPLFTRDGTHVRCEIPISISEAALGCQLQIPTLTGKVRMRIPAGTQSGASFRLAGKGFLPLKGKEQGDQLITVVVETPAELTTRQRELYEELFSQEKERLPRRAAFRRTLVERGRQ